MFVIPQPRLFDRLNHQIWCSVLVLGLVLEVLEWFARTKKDRDGMKLFFMLYLCFVGMPLLSFSEDFSPLVLFEVWSFFFVFVLGFIFIWEWGRKTKKAPDSI
jgi:O-antigen ligase